MRTAIWSTMFALTFLTTLSASAENRIYGYITALDRAARCGNKGVPENKCQERQKKAHDRGCITQEEYDTVVRENVVPICDPDAGDGLEQLASVCPCGCFHPDSRITMVSTETDTLSAMSARTLFDTPSSSLAASFSVAALAPDATMHRFEIDLAGVKRMTQGRETRPLIVIEAANGSTLKLTSGHAVLTDAGVMVAAKDLSRSDRLVDLGGNSVDILRLGTEAYDGDVFNVLTAGEDELSHVIFAEGLAVGDLAWQNSLQDELGAVIVRQ